MTTLYQITYEAHPGSRLVGAGLLINEKGKCISAAPALAQWVLGRTISQIKAHCESAGYLLEKLDADEFAAFS